MEKEMVSEMTCGRVERRKPSFKTGGIPYRRSTRWWIIKARNEKFFFSVQMKRLKRLLGIKEKVPLCQLWELACEKIERNALQMAAGRVDEKTNENLEMKVKLEKLKAEVLKLEVGNAESLKYVKKLQERFNSYEVAYIEQCFALGLQPEKFNDFNDM